MISENVTVQISSGLETRPIAMLVQVASRYQSSVQLESGSRRVNAKSIMGMMALGIDNGETVTIRAEGVDEAEAMASIREYLTQDGR